MDDDASPLRDHCEGDEYRRQLAYAKSYLPFLKEVINGSNFGIQEEHLAKLRSLYDMVDSKRLLFDLDLPSDLWLYIDKLKSCQGVLDSLYSKYHKSLTKEQLQHINDSKKLVELNKEETIAKSSEMTSTLNKSDQDFSNKSNISNKIPALRDMKDNLINKQLDSSEQHTEPMDNFLDNMENREFSCSNSSNNDDDPAILKNDLPEFSDSRIRLNKVIGFATHASIEKLNASDKNVKEIAKEIFEEITRQNANQAICQNLLKGINMDDINVDHVKKVIESIHGTKNIEPLQEPPLPPTNLLGFGLSRVPLIKPVEAVVENEISKLPEERPNSTLIHSKVPSIREKLNSDINVLHKIGATSEPKQKYITSLKPGTLIDLENSKITRSSLHIESLRPSVKLNEKNTDIKSCGVKLIEKITDSKFGPDIAVRDPRIRKKCLMNPENINSIPLPIEQQLILPTPLIPAVQSSTPNYSSLLSPNTSLTNSTLFESKVQEMTPPLAPMNSLINNGSQQEISVYNGSSNFLSHHINMQPCPKQTSTEYNGNSNQLQFNSCKSFGHNQYKHLNDSTVDNQNNDFSQYSTSFNQIHVNPISLNETMRHREPVSSFKSYHEARRDPRSMNSVKKNYEHRNYKEYREAKYGSDKNSCREIPLKRKMYQNYEHDRYRTSTRDDNKRKNTYKTGPKNSYPYRNLGVINDSASIKSFKIPKIKRKDEIVDNNIKDTELKTKKDTDITETIKTTKKDLSVAINKDNNLDKNLESEIVKNNNMKFDSNETEEGTKIEKLIATSSSNTKDEVGDKSIENYTLNEHKKEASKPKKPKKCSKEKEFEKIVKEAVKSLNDDECGPRTRTRSSLKKQEKEIPKKLNLDDSCKIDNEKKITSVECNKNINTISHQDKEDLIKTVDIGHNIISSTSKEILEVDRSTETISESHQDNIVSSNEINSTADTPSNSKIKEKVLNNLLANPKLMSLLQDEEKLEKLSRLLEDPPDIENINKDTSKNQNLSNEDIINKRNKSKEIKRLSKKEKKKRKKELKLKNKSKESSIEESQNIAQANAILHLISDNVTLDQEENPKEEETGLDSLNNVENSIDNLDHLPTNHVKPRSNKSYKNRKYDQYEIRKDEKCEDFKIVIAKNDKNGKKIENSNLANNALSTSKRKISTNDETLQIVKPKKPFLGPLSVKLARSKMVTEQKDSQKYDEKSQLEFEVDSEKKVKHDCESNQMNKNGKFNCKLLNNAILEPPYVVLKPIEDNSSITVTSSITSTVTSEATNIQGKHTISEKNSSKITCNDTNVIADNRPEVKKHRPKMTELDKLHADINENCAAVLSVPSVRQCRTNKQVDYVNSNNIFSHKKNKTSNVEQLTVDGELSSGVEKPKAIKKQSCKLTLKLKKKQYVKKYSTKNMLSPEKNIMPSKKLKVSQSCKLNKLKSTKKKNKKSMNSYSLTSTESYEDFNLRNESEHEVTSEITPKVLTENELKDKLYFQSAVDLMECKFCNYKDKGIDIVRHYVENHQNEEVLPSRLSKDKAELLIIESCNEDYAFNTNQFEDSKLSCVPTNVNFRCVFCDTIFFNIKDFLDHITYHTGEYRYKCKMCEQIFSDENKLEKHILKHKIYDKTNGISLLLLPNPIQSNKLFGYLCAFCYYVQLDYKNMVKHMSLRHFDEDKKCNGHWTIIRVNMSIENNNFVDSVIDYNNLVGCIPPVLYEESTHQTISRDTISDGEMQQINKSELEIFHSKNKLKEQSIIKKEFCEQEMYNAPESNMSCPLSKLIKIDPPCKSESINMHQLSPKHVSSPAMSEFNLLQQLPKQANSLFLSEPNLPQLSPNQTNVPCKSEIMQQLSPKQGDLLCMSDLNLPQLSPKQTNYPHESNSIMQQILPEQVNPSCLSESNILQLSPKHLSPPYILESNLLQLSPKQRNSLCTSEPILTQLSSKLVYPPCISESNIHQLSPTKSNHSCITESNVLELSLEQKILQSHINEYTMSEEEPELNDHNYVEYTLKDISTKCIVAGLSCEFMDRDNTILLFKCSVSKCLKNEFSTIFLSNLFKHIEMNHQFLVWDGKCDICNHKVQTSSEQHFLRDALEHLVSYHLILKNTEQPKILNVLDLKKTPSLPTMCQEIEKNKENKPMLRIRCLPGDTLSIPKNKTAIASDDLSTSQAPTDSHSIKIKGINVIEELNENSVVENSEKLNQNIVLNTPIELLDNQTNINEVSNYEKSSKIADVMSLKRNNSEVNTSKLINDDPTLCTKAIYSEIVLPEFVVKRNLGLQIVNNGEPVNNVVYTVIDTNFTKDLLKKLRELPMHVLKSRYALKEMMSVPKLLGLYKCLERSCTQVFVSKDLFVLHMKLHFSNTEKKKKNQIHSIEQFKKCAYCFKSFDSEVSLANHIENNYEFCNYCCPYCFYRAYSPSHVIVHQSLIHNKSKLLVLKLQFGEENCKNQNEMLKVVNFKNFVHTYSCKIGGCEFKCYLENDFISHLNQVHQRCDKYCCYICAEDKGEDLFVLQPKALINHFKLHNINLYQCIFCLFGTEIIDSMIKHLAMEHFEYEPLCLERAHMKPSDIYDGEEISNLKIIRLQKAVDSSSLIETVKLPSDTTSFHEILPKKTKKRRSNGSDVLSAALKSAQIDESTQSSDAIVITVPDSAQMTNNSSLTLTSAIDNEFIILDDINQNDNINQNDDQPPCKIDNVWSVVENNQDVDDVIIIDDDDDDDDDGNNDESNKVENVPTKRKHSVGEPIGNSIKPKRLALPIVALDQLFDCKQCDIVFSNGNDYNTHLNRCPFWNPDGQQCFFCSKIFKTTLNMTEHVRLHGPDRFKCSLCNVNVPSCRAITHHMKINHSIVKLDFVPVHSNLNNLDKDEFIVHEEKTLDEKKNKTDTCVKKKRLSNFGNKKGSSKAKDDKTKSQFFSPDTIDNIPKVHIFSEPIGCSLCSYNTKVRSNLVMHLQGHEKGQDNTTKEIVNPVPSMGKSELMFDKMINLSASSFEAMNTEKMKIDEFNKKIVEVAPRDNLNMELFPQFITKNVRYKCSVTSCTYIGMTQDMLKKHISILHPNNQYYICPHCTLVQDLPKTIDMDKIDLHLMHHGDNLYKCQYCDYIDFNRIEMRTHMRNTHFSEINTSNQSHIIVIRQSMLEDECIDRTKYVLPTMAQWVCNICSSGIKYTENDIMSHILVAHKVTNMFKCPMCPFEHINDDSKIFEEHYKLKHPSVAVKCLKVYDKIDNVNEQQKQSKLQWPGAAYILEQQALESIEPTIVPPACRGIPIDSIPTPKTYNKSRGVSKSPKAAAKNSPNQARKQLISTDTFSKDDSLGSLSSNGLFTCPRCNTFETMNLDHFREHLYKDVNYKTWKCLQCFEISDSPKKMAWHVKKHGIGIKYEKNEDDEKLKWVERVIVHQNSLLNGFQKQNKERHVRGGGIEQKTDIHDKKTLDSSPSKKKKIVESDKKVPNSKITPLLNGEIIDLLDDSDDE